MSTILKQLITDRTQDDVKEWLNLRAKGLAAMTEAEKEKWIAGMRGSYNASDLNRVTSAMSYLANLYRQYGYAVAYTPISIAHADGSTDTIWRLTDIPTDEQMAEFLRSLTAFWAAVETVEGSVIDVWENNGFGYVDMGGSVNVGDFAALTAATGVLQIFVTVSSKQLATIRAAGTGWSVTRTDSALTAPYTAPLGVYEDLQDALDALVLVASSDEEGSFANATVTLGATLRSGSAVELGTGAVRWSSIINWAALEAYAFTWADIEAAGMTWADLEGLPVPTKEA